MERLENTTITYYIYEIRILLERPALLRTLEAWPWSYVYGIRDPDKVLNFITRGIVKALMAKRDSLGLGPRYRAVRNRVTALVRRDKEASNHAKLVESGNSPAVL
jgi:hypothetical protein